MPKGLSRDARIVREPPMESIAALLKGRVTVPLG